MLEQKIKEKFLTKGWTLSLAESCTGGQAAGRLVQCDGASGYFLGGVVAYSNDVKTKLLGVSPLVLEQEGAVSVSCCRAMARGVLEMTGSMVAGAVTGICGPTGGSLEKPVGLVFLAVLGPHGLREMSGQFQGERVAIQQQVCDALFKMILEA